MWEKVEQIEDMLLDMIICQLTSNADRVCAKELGEVFDMLKDTAEFVYYTKKADS